MITGVVIAAARIRKARREAGIINELHAGEGVLVRWSYTPEEWDGFVAKVIAQRKKDVPWKILLIPVPTVGLLWLLVGMKPFIFIPGAGIAFIWMLVYFQSQTLAKLGRGDVIISRDGALIHDRWFDWSHGDRLLTDVTYEDGNPASILFKWVSVSLGAGGGATSDVMVPVPHGHEKEAVHLVSTMSPHVERHSNRGGVQASGHRPIPTSKTPPFETLTRVLNHSGMAAIVFAWAAAIGERSWPIGVVAVSLSLFELWGIFLSPRSRSFLTWRIIVQFALVATFFYAVGAHESHRHSSNRPAPPPSRGVYSSAPFTPAIKIYST